MGKLQSSRATDATKISVTDDNVRDLEEDIAEIIGVDQDLEIVSPIFNTGSSASAAVRDGSEAVNSDGSISGVIRLLSTSGSASAAAGIEFQTTGGDRFKICATTDAISLYEYDDSTAVWTEVYDFSAGVGTFIGLSDVTEDPKTYTGNAGKYVKVNSSEDGIDFGTPSAGSIDELEDIADVPAYSGNTGKFLALTGGAGSETPTWSSQAPGTGAENFVELDDVNATFNVGSVDAGKHPVVQNVGTYGSPSYKLYERPAYNVKIPIYKLRDQALGKTNNPNASGFRTDFDGGTYYVYFTAQTSNPATYGGDINTQICPQYSGAGSVTPEIRIPALYKGLWMYNLVLYIQERNGRGFYAQQAADTGFNEARRMGPEYHTCGCPMTQQGSGTNAVMIPLPAGDYHEENFTWYYCHRAEAATAPIFTIKLRASSVGDNTIQLGNGSGIIGWFHAVMLY